MPNFGRVILHTDRSSFDIEVERFKRNLAKYHGAVVKEFEKVKSDFEKSLVKEYIPRWKKRPPACFKQHGIEPTSENLEKELRLIVQEVISKALSFEKPRVRVVYKNVAPESVRDPKFLEPLRQKMRRRRMPLTRIGALFRMGDAAPASEKVAQKTLL